MLQLGMLKQVYIGTIGLAVAAAPVLLLVSAAVGAGCSQAPSEEGEKTDAQALSGRYGPFQGGETV